VRQLAAAFLSGKIFPCSEPWPTGSEPMQSKSLKIKGLQMPIL
jgi:hypothetical protein